MKYEKYQNIVEGKEPVEIFMFTLSTCIWCKKTKKLLKDLGYKYSFIDVDLVGDDLKDQVEKDFQEKNADMSFPTIVVGDGDDVIIGFDEEKIKETLEKWMKKQ